MNHQFKVDTWKELKDLPRLEYQIDELLPKGGLTLLYGPPAVGKTFVVLSLSLSVTTGEQWLGRDAAAGCVVYVSAEPAPLRERVGAWLAAHGLHDPGPFLAVRAAPQLHDETQVWALIADLKAQVKEPIALVIFDTLARCFVGGEENQAKDVGLLIGAADRLRKELGCGVVLVHHSTKEGGDYRGSSALLAGVNTMMELVPNGTGGIRLRCQKQKDAQPFDDIPIKLVPHGESVVAVSGEGGGIKDGAEALLNVLKSAGRPLLWNEWFKTSGLPESTFNRYRAQLERAKLVNKGTDGRYVVGAGESDSSPAGSQLSMRLHACNESPRPLPPHATPVGVAVGVGSDRGDELEGHNRVKGGSSNVPNAGRSPAFARAA